MDKPEPPESLAKTVADGVERQDADTLRDVAEWAAALAEWKDRELTPDEVKEEAVAEGEELEDVEAGSSGVIVKKKIPCGKDCGGCPHGPYKYRAYRDGDTVKTDYVGPA